MIGEILVCISYAEFKFAILVDTFYHESALYHDLGEETAGAFVVDFYAHRMIPVTRERERKLAKTLNILRLANRWK